MRELGVQQLEQTPDVSSRKLRSASHELLPLEEAPCEFFALGAEMCRDIGEDPCARAAVSALYHEIRPPHCESCAPLISGCLDVLVRYQAGALGGRSE